MNTLGVITYDTNRLKTAQVHLQLICRYDIRVYALPYCDLYLINGAGSLSAECLQSKRVLNGHPGVTPAARGLDAFKWSIYDMLPLCVTLHCIDERIDVGEVVSSVPTPVFPSGTLETLARRRYENENRMLVHFDEYLEHPQNPFAGIAQRESTLRMKAEQERMLPECFVRYKQQAMSLVENTAGGQMPPRAVWKTLTWESALRDLRKEAA